ncbi:hypothetical protein BB560_006605, partial [Smittium megazygosporum]
MDSLDQDEISALNKPFPCLQSPAANKGYMESDIDSVIHLIQYNGEKQSDDTATIPNSPTRVKKLYKVQDQQSPSNSTYSTFPRYASKKNENAISTQLNAYRKLNGDTESLKSFETKNNSSYVTNSQYSPNILKENTETDHVSSANSFFQSSTDPNQSPHLPSAIPVPIYSNTNKIDTLLNTDINSADIPENNLSNQGNSLFFQTPETAEIALSSLSLFGKTKCRPKPLNIKKSKGVPDFPSGSPEQIEVFQHLESPTSPSSPPIEFNDSEIEKELLYVPPKTKKDSVERLGYLTLRPQYLNVVTSIMSSDFIALMGIETSTNFFNFSKKLDTSSPIYSKLTCLDSSTKDFIFGSNSVEWPLNHTSLSTQIILGTKFQLQQKRMGKASKSSANLSSRDVLFSTCKGLSMWAFIINLTDKNTGSNTTMIGKLLSSFRVFAHPVDLLRLLIVRYINCDFESYIPTKSLNSDVLDLGLNPDPDSFTKSMQIIRLRTINIIKNWLKNYKDDFTEFYHLRLLLLQFIDYLKLQKSMIKIAKDMEFRLLEESVPLSDNEHLADYSTENKNAQSSFINQALPDSYRAQFQESSASTDRYSDYTRSNTEVLSTYSANQIISPLTSTNSGKSYNTCKANTLSEVQNPGGIKVNNKTKTVKPKTSFFALLKMKTVTSGDKLQTETIKEIESHNNIGPSSLSEQKGSNEGSKKYSLPLDDSPTHNSIPFPSAPSFNKLDAISTNTIEHNVLNDDGSTYEFNLAGSQQLLDHMSESRRSSDISILDMDPGLIAGALAIIEHQLFRKISAGEISKRIHPLFNSSNYLYFVLGIIGDDRAVRNPLPEKSNIQNPFYYKQNKKDTPNISALAEWSNRTTYWASLLVLSQTSKLKRANMIAHITHIAYYCLALRNYNSAFGLVGGLTNSSVGRLYSTWKLVPAQFKAIVKYIQEIWTARPNHRLYRESLSASLLGELGPDYELVFDPNPDFLYMDQINDADFGEGMQGKRHRTRNESFSGVKSFFKLISAKEQNLGVKSNKSISPRPRRAFSSSNKGPVLDTEYSTSSERKDSMSVKSNKIFNSSAQLVPGSDATLYETELIKEISRNSNDTNSHIFTPQGTSAAESAKLSSDNSDLKRAFSLVDVSLINRARLIRNKTVNGRLRSATNKSQGSDKKEKTKMYSLQNSKSLSHSFTQAVADQKKDSQIKSFEKDKSDILASSSFKANRMNSNGTNNSELEARSSQLSNSNLSLKEPVMPFFGLHLKDLIYADEANKSYVEDRDFYDLFNNALDFKNSFAALPKPNKLNYKPSQQLLKSNKVEPKLSLQHKGLRSFNSGLDLSADSYRFSSDIYIMNMMKFRIISDIFSEIRDSQEMRYNLNVSNQVISFLKSSINAVENEILEFSKKSQNTKVEENNESLEASQALRLNLLANRELSETFLSGSQLDKDRSQNQKHLDYGHMFSNNIEINRFSADSLLESNLDGDPNFKFSGRSSILERANAIKYRMQIDTNPLEEDGVSKSEGEDSDQSGENKLDQAFFKLVGDSSSKDHNTSSLVQNPKDGVYKGKSKGDIKPLKSNNNENFRESFEPSLNKFSIRNTSSTLSSPISEVSTASPSSPMTTANTDNGLYFVDSFKAPRESNVNKTENSSKAR